MTTPFVQLLLKHPASTAFHIAVLRIRETFAMRTMSVSLGTRARSSLAAPVPDVDLHAENEKVRKTRWAAPGDPKASAAAVLKVVDADEPPLRVFFGDAPLGLAKADYEERLRTWEQWQSVAELAQG